MTLPHPDHLHTTAQAAEALGVPAARIRRWAHEGKIVAAGRLPGRGGSQPLYYLAELMPCALLYAGAAPRRDARREA